MNGRAMCFALLLTALAADASGQEMCIKGGYPAQINPLSCQSRFFAMALGHLEPKLFPITDDKSLLALETDIRNAITKIEPDPKLISHSTWKQAIEEYTGNHFTLKETSFKNKDDFVAKLAEMAGWSINLKQPTPPSFPIHTKRIPGISIKEIAGQTYSQGHVVAVLSVDLLTRELVIANSWQKDARNKPLREGHVVLTDDVVFKTFGNPPAYLIYEIVRK